MLGSEIKVCRFAFGEVLASPNAQTFLFRRLRSSYPLAGCSPAEPASVSLDDKSLSAAWTGSMVGIHRWALPTNPGRLFPLRQRMANRSNPRRLFYLRQQDNARSSFSANREGFPNLEPYFLTRRIDGPLNQ